MNSGLDNPYGKIFSKREKHNFNRFFVEGYLGVFFLGLRSESKMPCRDDDRDIPVDHHYRDSQATNKKLRKRNDELAAENCQLRAVICRLYNICDFQKIEPQLSELHLTILHQAIRDQKIHRGKDKKRAIKAISKEMNGRQQRAITIKELGGLPSKELLEEIKDFQDQLAKIKKSDPMKTDFY